MSKSPHLGVFFLCGPFSYRTEFSIHIWNHGTLFPLWQSYPICTWFVEQNINFSQNYGGLSMGTRCLLEAIRKHDAECKNIRERDGVKIVSRTIFLKNKLQKKKPRGVRELEIPNIQSTHALTMNCKTKKVCSACLDSVFFFIDLSFIIITFLGIQKARKLIMRLQRS